MRSGSSGLIVIALIVSFSGSLNARQRESVRDWVREHGDLGREMISCGPPVGIREIVEHTQLTVEGIVSHAESALSADEEYVYTEYVIDVTRIWRMTTRVTDHPGSTGPSPFLGGDGSAIPGGVTARVRLRLPWTGSVRLDGGVFTTTSGFPTLEVGEHVIASAYLSPDVGGWVPFGIFGVGARYVVGLERWSKKLKYDSVEAFASALANPPPTPAR